MRVLPRIDGRMPAILCLLLPGGLLALLFVATVAMGQERQPTASQPTGGLGTWAVLFSDELQQSGLEDQVLAALATDKAITIVARQHLELLAKEVAATSLVNASDAWPRRKTGVITKADALAVLTLESSDKEQYIRLVICDTRAGARLMTDCIAYKADRLSQVSKSITDAIQQACRHFPCGVQRVYAVPPFVSRNLGHEYDHLQRGFASMLANALSSQDGVAVVEIDEARQIARETSLAGGEDIHRIVPSFIEGEYKMSQPQKDKPPDIDFVVRITGNDSPINRLQRTVRLSEMVGYLSKDLPALILGETLPNSQALTAEQQAAALAVRADVFARLGAWQHSTSLREAALLLKDDADQRIALAREYHKAAVAPLPKHMIAGSKECEAMCGSRLRTWACALPHLAYLVRNGQVDARAAGQEIERLAGYQSLWRVHNSASCDDLAQAEAARRQFVQSVYPSVFSLKLNGKSALFLTRDAAEKLIMDTNKFDKEYLDLVYKLFEYATPAEEHFRPAFVYKLAGWSFERGHDAIVSDGLSFYDRLSRSARLDNRLTGQLGRVCLEWAQGGAPGPLLDRVQAIADEFAGQKDITEANRGQIGVLMHLRQVLAAATRPASAAPVAKQTTEDKMVPDRPADQVTYEPLAINVQRLDGRSLPFKEMTWKAAEDVGNSGLRLVNCGDVDFYWCAGALLLHRKRDVLEEILVEPKAVFADAKWDGRNLWLAACSGTIRLIGKDGKETYRVDRSDGLPECDRTILVYPFAEGKAIASGSLGPHDRMWIAMVDATGRKPNVKVLHRATRVKGISDARTDQEADLAARPIWIQEYPPIKGQPRVLLVGRGRIAGLLPAPMPLSVDLQTLTIGIGYDHLSGSEPTSFCKYSDHLLYAVHRVPTVIGSSIVRQLGKPSGWNGQSTHILNWNEYLYVTGFPWFRVNPKDWQSEPLVPQRVPVEGAMQARWGVSIHHGIVCWSNQDDF